VIHNLRHQNRRFNGDRGGGGRCCGGRRRLWLCKEKSRIETRKVILTTRRQIDSGSIRADDVGDASVGRLERELEVSEIREIRVSSKEAVCHEKIKRTHDHWHKDELGRFLGGRGWGLGGGSRRCGDDDF
jgi:hypothetical protein